MVDDGKGSRVLEQDGILCWKMRWFDLMGGVRLDHEFS